MLAAAVAGAPARAHQRVRFRHKLEGRDRDGQDAGTRPQAFYNEPPPGNCRFRMTALNDSSVWNAADTFVDFSIAPAYCQTVWFRSSGVAGFVGVLGAFYYLRLGEATRRERARMEARLDERERIARDLHDTLLQGVQGLILKLDAVAKRIPVEDAARCAIEEALDRAHEVVTECRDRVRGLRADSALADLPSALERVAREAPLDGTTRFKSLVEGQPRELDPIALGEAFAVGREALRNALAHSRGAHVELKIAYDPGQLRLQIRDDGRGIDREFVGTGARSDHWGIQGMRERSLRMGAHLEIRSRPGAGTEVALTVPAATAYRDPGIRVSTPRVGRAPGPSESR
jgi:signal transduction histidine kinase